MVLRFFLVLCLAMNMVGCKNNQDPEKIESLESNLESKTDSSKVSVLFGHTDDGKAFKHLSFINYQKDSDLHEKIRIDLHNDSIKVLFPATDKPLIYNLFAFGDNANYTTRIFVNPGDSIYLNIQDKHITFTGDKSAEKNFFTLLDPTEMEWAKNKFDGDFIKYKANSDSIYKRRNDFFKDYVKNNNVSDEFKRIVGAELRYEFLYNLISPRAISNEFGYNINEEGGILRELSERVKTDEGVFFDFSEYFDGISIEDFKDASLIDNDYFRRSLTNYIRYYFVNSENPPFSSQSFQDELKYIESNLQPTLQDYSIFKLITDYHQNGFGSGQLDRENLVKLIDNYKDKFNGTKYYERITEIEQELKSLNFEFSNDILDEDLLTLKGESLKFGELLNTTKGKIRVLDFWASWCAPCISEMKKSKDSKNKLYSNNDIEWIYVSVDKSEQKWINAAQELKDDLETEHQYLLFKGSKSLLIKYLKVNTIPRYVILDADNRIVVFNSPKPSSSNEFNGVIENLKENAN